MKIEPHHPRTERKIGEHTLQVPQPYAAGDVLTEATASILNQTFAENISNNTRKKLEAGHVPADGPADAEAVPHTQESAQAVIDAYVEGYEPGVRRGGGGEPRVTDPVEKEARKIARDKAGELVKSRGLKTGDVDMSEIAGKVFEANKEALMKAAKKIVADRAKASGDQLDLTGIDLGGGEPAADETVTA